MPLISCEINLILVWSSTCVITSFTGAETFAISDTKLYVPVVTLLTQNNAKLLQQIKVGNILFVLSTENEDDRKARTRYYLPEVEITNYQADNNVPGKSPKGPLKF